MRNAFIAGDSFSLMIHQSNTQDLDDGFHNTVHLDLPAPISRQDVNSSGKIFVLTLSLYPEG